MKVRDYLGHKSIIVIIGSVMLHIKKGDKVKKEYLDMVVVDKKEEKDRLLLYV